MNPIIPASLIVAGLAVLAAGCGSSSAPDGAGAAATPYAAAIAADPPLSVDPSALAQSLTCTDFSHPDKPAVLLVHGTFTSGYEQYEWTYKPLLTNLGYDVCYVTYPDRGLGDSQVSAEYVVNAIRQTYLRSGHRIAVIGHSQGVSVTRWALRWFPSTRIAVDDFIAEAGPNKGTTTSMPFELVASLGLVGVPEVLLQFGPSTHFVEAENRGGQTPGDVSYTALYTRDDELVQPVSPLPTAALDYGLGNPRVTNVLLQDVCPNRIVDHVSIGLVDALAFQLALDAIAHPGPANVDRTVADAGGTTAICGLVSIAPTLVIAPLPQLIGGLLTAVSKENGLPALHLATQEPPLKPYAQ